MAADVFVRPSAVPGDLEGGDGSAADPFRSVRKGIAEVHDRGAGAVRLFGGHFVESVELVDVAGPGEADPIVVRPVDGTGEVVIDSCLPQFLPRRWTVSGSPSTKSPGSTARSATTRRRAPTSRSAR